MKTEPQESVTCIALLSSGVGAEFLICRWEAKAEALEESAQRQRSEMMGLVAMTLERARAYRECVKDLKRHMEAASSRQPEDNGADERPPMSAPELPTDAQGGSLDPLVRALREAGYAVADGAADVRNLIHAVSDDGAQPLCSGWRVFPDGKRCEGCADCSPNVPSSATDGSA